MQKAVNFGIIYGMSDYGLAEQLGVTVKEAKSFIEKYFEKYAEIKDYMNKSIAFGKENGYVSTVLNRKRYIPEINEKNYMRQEFGKRLAMNSPIQGSAADIIKLAMIKVDQLLKENHMKSKMILQVHDELIFDVYQDELDKMMKLVKEGMESAYQMKVELKGKKATNDISTFEEKQYGDIWTNDEYLQFMYERIVIMKELLSDTGVLYIHCDWHKGHYIKCIMDELFGADNFINEITWYYYNKMAPKSSCFPRTTDKILVYSKNA